MGVDDIINGIKDQSIDCLNLLIDDYGRLIYAVLNSILNTSYDKESISECFDDVLLNIWNNIDCFDEKRGNFKNWIISISKFKAIDYKRKNNKFLKKNNVISDDLHDNQNIEEDFIISEERSEVAELFKNLSEQDRNIFIKRYLYEESIDEIAKAMNLSKDYIYNRISRGKKKLKALKEAGLYE
ncbi:MAG: polymerase factor sigma-70 [Clostridiaceae bacterium]|jgi:RNA polymerase sigma-70 factor (ECF subfamily)|nr:polymerase factor sigma-70 [Clostridiaceae bacterium]